jgi:putative transcriptional regulator
MYITCRTNNEEAMTKKVGLANNLKKLRFDHGQITQENLAQQLDVSRQTIIAIEQGRFNPSVALALKMARYFRCVVEDIFFIKGD